MTTDDAADPRVVPEVHEKENPNEEANENDDESGETPDKPDEDHEMEGETFPEPDTAATSSPSRREKRTETQENVFVKRQLMAKSPKRPITLVPPPEDPVKRRLMKKTDMRNDEVVMNVDEHLVNVVNMLTKDENVPPTASTLSLKTMLAASSHDRNNDPESNHITVSIDVHTAFLHADVDQDLFAEPPEPDEWYDAGLKEDEVWKLIKALYGYRKAPKLWHQHLVSVLESLNYHPLLTDPSCFRNDETNTNIFVHVDDGLMFGPKSEVLILVELLSKQVLMRITGRMEQTGDKFYFLVRVIERTARGYSVEANPKYIRNVINVLGWNKQDP